MFGRVLEACFWARHLTMDQQPQHPTDQEWKEIRKEIDIRVLTELPTIKLLLTSSLFADLFACERRAWFSARSNDEG